MSAGDLSGRWMRRAKTASERTVGGRHEPVGGEFARGVGVCEHAVVAGPMGARGRRPLRWSWRILRIAGCDRLGHLYLLAGLVEHDTTSGGRDSGEGGRAWGAARGASGGAAGCYFLGIGSSAEPVPLVGPAVTWFLRG